jgi:hypothetical protein
MASMGFSSFFKKLSKEEYRRNMETKMGHAVLVTQAQIHTPSSSPSTAASSKARKRTEKRADSGESNVSRAESETDVIEVVVLDGEEGENNAGVNGNGKKISKSLFKKRKNENKGKKDVDDVSVDVDFYNVAKGNNEAPVERKCKVKEMVRIKDVETKMGDADEEEKRPKMDDADKEAKRPKVADKQEKEEKRPKVGDADKDKEEKRREGKISLKLFGKKQKKTEKPAQDDDSVDFDFLQSSHKRPRTPPTATAEAVKDPPSPELFKQRPPATKKRRRGGAAAHRAQVNYDSDSLDVEVLSKMSAKAFGGGGGSPDDSSSNAFTALMKKPLADNYKRPVVETGAAESDISPAGNKENSSKGYGKANYDETMDKGRSEVSANDTKKTVSGNAFAKLMTAAKTKGVWAAAEAALSEKMDVVDSETNVTRKERECQEQQLSKDKTSVKENKAAKPKKDGRDIFAKLMSESKESSRTASTLEGASSINRNEQPLKAEKPLSRPESTDHKEEVADVKTVIVDKTANTASPIKERGQPSAKEKCLSMSQAQCSSESVPKKDIMVGKDAFAKLMSESKESSRPSSTLEEVPTTKKRGRPSKAVKSSSRPESPDHKKEVADDQTKTKDKKVNKVSPKKGRGRTSAKGKSLSKAPGLSESEPVGKDALAKLISESKESSRPSSPLEEVPTRRKRGRPSKAEKPSSRPGSPHHKEKASDDHTQTEDEKANKVSPGKGQALPSAKSKSQVARSSESEPVCQDAFVKLISESKDAFVKLMSESKESSRPSSPLEEVLTINKRDEPLKDEQPLSRPVFPHHKEEVADDQTQAEDEKANKVSKSQAEHSSESEPIGKDAFAKLMSESKESSRPSSPLEEVPTRKKRGRPSKAEKPPSRPQTPDYIAEDSAPPLSDRRSSRILKNKDVSDQKRKEQEEMERMLDDEITEGVKSQRSKKRQREEEMIVDLAEEEDDSDDEIKIEKIVLSPMRKKKATASFGGGGKLIASIFIKGKKANPIKIIEDPEKVAARKAFLMSSAPDVLRSSTGAGVCDEDEDLADFAPFASLGHVRQQQDDDKDPFWHLPMQDVAFAKKKAETAVEQDNHTEAAGIGQFCRLSPSHLNSARGLAAMPSSAAAEQSFRSPSAVVERLSSLQIYHFVKGLSEEGEERGDAFPVNAVFRRFVEKKVESDAIEAEARSKNLVR